MAHHEEKAVVYPHLVFRDRTDVTAAIRVLSGHAGRILYGRGSSDIPIVGELADQIDDLLTGDAWAAFLLKGEEVAGWADGSLVVHSSGPWDAALEGVPHSKEPWSWLEVGVSDAWGGRGCDSSDPVVLSIRRHFAEEQLIQWLAPVGVDILSVWGETVSSRRSIRKSSQQLMIGEPITEQLLVASPEDPALVGWWTDVLDRVGTKYHLAERFGMGRSSDEAPPAPADELELRIELRGDLRFLEALLEAISLELEGRGAEVDDWFESGGCMCLPISGPDLPRLLQVGAGMARTAGYSVANPPPS